MMGGYFTLSLSTNNLKNYFILFFFTILKFFPKITFSFIIIFAKFQQQNTFTHVQNLQYNEKRNRMRWGNKQKKVKQNKGKKKQFA